MWTSSAWSNSDHCNQHTHIDHYCHQHHVNPKAEKKNQHYIHEIQEIQDIQDIQDGIWTISICCNHIYWWVRLKSVRESNNLLQFPILYNGKHTTTGCSHNKKARRLTSTRAIDSDALLGTQYTFYITLLVSNVTCCHQIYSSIRLRKPHFSSS